MANNDKTLSFFDKEIENCLFVLFIISISLGDLVVRARASAYYSEFTCMHACIRPILVEFKLF